MVSSHRIYYTQPSAVAARMSQLAGGQFAATSLQLDVAASGDFT
ncbi:MAG: hypothetical protein WAK55_06830 [Xanthobacteraceae bacterium]